MHKLLFSIIIVLAGVLIAIPHAIADQAVYRWIDEDGNVYFGDRAPEGVNAVEFTVRPSRVELTSSQKSAGSSPDPETPADAGQEATLSVAEQRRRSRAERRQQYTEDKRKMDSQCEAMRRQMAFVEPSPRILVRGEDGEPRRLDDDEREELLAEANAFLAENCN